MKNLMTCFIYKIQLIFLIVALSTYESTLEGVGSYIQVYQGIANGGISFTGNTLALAGLLNREPKMVPGPLLRLTYYCNIIPTLPVQQ